MNHRATLILSIVMMAAGSITTSVAAENQRPFARVAHREALLAGCQALSIDRGSLMAAAATAECRLEGVPLGQIRTADLQLHRVSVVADDALRVIMDENQARSVDGPATKIWQGSVIGEPNSEVFLADGPAGTFGWVLSDGERYVFTTGDPTGDRTLVSYPSTGIASALIEWSPFECAAVDRGGIQGPPPMEETGGIAGGEVCMTIDIAVEALKCAEYLTPLLTDALKA